MLGRRDVRKRRGARSIAAGTLLLGMLVGVGAFPHGSAAGASQGGLHLLGRLSLPKDAHSPYAASHEVFFINSVGGRLYYAYRQLGGPDANSTYIREYDLAPTIPAFVRETRLASSDEMATASSLNPNVVALDRKRNRLLILSFSGAPILCGEGPTDDPACGGRGAIGRVFIVDLKELRVTDTWVLSDRVPGFYPQGLTFSAEDDRIYTIGLVGPPVNPNDLFIGNVPRNPPVAIAALEPESGEVAWIRPVPECAVQMSSADFGAFVFRSRLQPALYFPCIRTETSLETAGLSRLWVEPNADSREAVNFPLEMFPISGSYVTGKGITGVASFDPATDRVFMTSQSQTTPGAWVFDGRLSAWVGFIAAPGDNNRWATVDTSSGRYYMGGDPERRPGYLVVSDGRQTPVPQGQVVPFDNGAVTKPISVDPPGRRLFVERLRKDRVREWLVYRDSSPLREPPEDIDYDDLTIDVEEGANTFTTFAGSTNGFGTQLLLTGGVGGLTTGFTTLPASPGDISRMVIDAFVQGAFRFQPSRGDRSISAARITSLDLRNVGASAGAQALGLDPISDGEYETAVRATANRLRNNQEIRDEEREREEGRPDDRDEIGDDVERQLAWPHREAFCLDGSGDARKDVASTGGGRSEVSCDLKGEAANTSSSFEAVASEGVSIAYSSFSSNVVRDPKVGMVTKTTAIARGIQLSAPAGTVTIDRIIATATTQARGRAKTAKAQWERRLEGVTIKNAAGDALYECTQGESCDIGAAVAAMNRVLATRMRVSLPQPAITATDGGAFAAVEEADGDFVNGLVANNDNSRAVPAMTITVYNDWTEKSRLVVQLAAIQASSIYGISPLPGSETGGGDIPIPVPPVGELPIPPAPILDGVLPPPTGAPPVGRLIESPLFLIRSPKQAFLFGLTLLLFGGAAAAIWRRRTLIRELNA